MLRIADEDAASCKAIGDHGLDLIKALHRRKSKRVPGETDVVGDQCTSACCV